MLSKYSEYQKYILKFKALFLDHVNAGMAEILFYLISS